MKKEILDAIRSKGLLLEKEIFDVLKSYEDVEIAKGLLDNLERVSGQKMITRASLTKNYEYAQNAVRGLPGEMKEKVEKVFIKLGVSLEIKKECEIKDNPGMKKKEESNEHSFNVFYSVPDNTKKIEVADFIGHFRSRYQEIQRILMHRQGLDNLTSINKISSGSRRSFSFIGIVSEKRITKNGNIIIGFEDLTGKISGLAKANSECFGQASELQLDDIVAVKCSGNNELVFIHEIVFPDSILFQKTKFNSDICVAFVSDVHAGSKDHRGREFENFLNWLNSDNELAKKIKYIFFVGDNIDGVGIFPGQEKLLELKSLKEQYGLVAKYIRKIPENITVFMCPGQHDSVRVPEPQPPIDKIYGRELHEISNLLLVPNPSMVSLKEGEKEFKILMYHGASLNTFINEIEELRMMKAYTCPAKAVKHLLKRRHLAPMHGVSRSIVYVPNSEKDPLVISEVPDVLCTGEVHRADIERYNGVLIITGSCWQSQTDYEEKVGHVPDPCKVPVLNLKTHEIKILDFSEGDYLR